MGNVVGTHIAPWVKPWWRYEDYELIASDGSPISEFGNSLSLSGDVAVIGAHKDLDNGIYAGAAYLFRYNPGTETWSEEQKLLASDGAMYDYFGYSVSISGDVAMSGAIGTNNSSGSAYVYLLENE